MFDDHADPLSERLQSVVVPRCFEMYGNRWGELPARQAQEPPLRMALQQDLRDHERDELSVRNIVVGTTMRHGAGEGES